MTPTGKVSRFDKLVKVDRPRPWPAPAAQARPLKLNVTQRLNLNCKCGGFLTGIVSAEDAAAIEKFFRSIHILDECGAADEAEAITAFAMRTVRECTAALHPEILSPGEPADEQTLSRSIR